MMRNLLVHVVVLNVSNTRIDPDGLPFAKNKITESMNIEKPLPETIIVLHQGRMKMTDEIYTWMECPDTRRDEPQYLVKMNVDGVRLRCGGCNKTYGREIGYFADKYQSLATTARNQDET